MNQRAREKLPWELETILAKEDSILFVRLSDRCVQDIPKYNRPGTWENIDKPFLII